jgi:O-antigen/teichoic acid export membrane protein
MLPVIALVIALRDPLIRLLFAPSFQPAASLISIQALGDYARIIGWSFGVCLFAQGYTRGHLLAVVAQALLWVVVSAPLIPQIGISAIPFGYSISYLAWPALMYPMARQWLGVRIEREPALLCVLGIVILVVVLLSPPLIGVGAAFIMPLTIYLSGLGRPAITSRT